MLCRRIHEDMLPSRRGKAAPHSLPVVLSKECNVEGGQVGVCTPRVTDMGKGTKATSDR